jgi:hypothetical protein
MAGVNYFPDATAHREFINLTYSRYFPVFEIMASYGRRYSYENDTAGEKDYRPTNEKLLRLGITLPFNFSRSIHTTNLDLTIAYNSIFYKKEFDGSFNDSDKVSNIIDPMEFGLKFLHFRQMGIKDINPKFGQSLILNYYKTSTSDKNFGERFVGHAVLYLPGILKHHSLSLKSSYEASSSNFRDGIYSLTTSAEFTRGYDRYNYEVFKKGTIEYTLPLGYPDRSLGSILYWKRLWANIFYDYGLLDWKGEQYLFRSVGLDLNFTFHLFNILQVPLEMGLRTSYLIEDDKFAYEFILFNVAF